MELFLLIITIIGLTLASYTDIKTREVPDYLSYSFFTIIVSTILIISISTNNYLILLSSLLGFVITATIGISLYYLKQWGGADAKILMSLGLVFGYFGINAILTLLASILIIGAIYTFIWVIILFFKDLKKAKLKTLKVLKKQKPVRLMIILFSFSILLILIFINIDITSKILIASLVLLLILSYYLLIFAKIIEDLGMIKKIPVSNLSEGDWLAKDIVSKNKILLSKRITSLTLEHISLLKQHNIKSIWIKVGVPFIPAILIGAIITFVMVGLSLLPF